MKKLLMSLAIISIISLPVFASNDAEKAELLKLRNAKNAQDTIINSQIKVYKNKIEQITLDETMPEAKKDAQLQVYAKKIEELSNKKLAIKTKYKKDKAAIKRKY